MDSWGREDRPNIGSRIGIIFLILFAPLLTLVFQIVNTNYAGSILDFIGDVEKTRFLPQFDSQVFIACIIWILFQMILAKLPDKLHLLLPFYKGGLQNGQLTPAGNELTYNINGLQSWLITHLCCYILTIYTKIIDPALIAKNWGAVFVSANILGYSLSLFAYLKAHLFPTHKEDNKYSGSFYYDFMMGIEFNPRLFNIDFKLFFNGRPGIIAWTLINYSFAALQYQKYGYISNSMILVNVLQGLYVLDFFWNENWYLKTIDIAHDHFGWYLCWGDCVWLPFMYTLQSVYLSSNPIILEPRYFNCILFLGIFGYIIFRWSNSQKDYFRRNNGFCKIWLLPAEYISCTFKTKNGLTHESKLLYSGFWGLARHMNYSGDIILSTCYCLACGFNHVLPYFYSIYMIMLLVNRCFRDENRCRQKYGAAWDKYCQWVPNRFLPIF